MTVVTKTPKIAHARLLEVMHYDPETGDFTRRITIGRWKAGTIAGTPHNKGYVAITIDREMFLRSRLAWFYMTGEWPVEIDHRDRKRNNDRYVNLRDVGHVENAHNKGAYRNNTSGVTGVNHRSDRGGPNPWVAGIRVNGVKIHLGQFPTMDAARAAYESAKSIYHGDSA